MMGDDTAAPSAGYRRPPVATRFRKGQSGNPRGRPRGKSRLPYEAVLGQLVTVRHDGQEQRLTAETAFLEFITRRGLEGDGPAGRATMECIERVRAAGGGEVQTQTTLMIGRVFSLFLPLIILDLARHVEASQPTAHFVLKPWLVQAALNRLGDQRLSLEDQGLVLEATSSPGRVRWPDWWEAKPR